METKASKASHYTSRSAFGGLIQIDGSVHDWFEGRGEKCCSLVFIDDATGCLMRPLFLLVETTEGYFQATKSYLKQYGRPISFYSDKHRIFKVNIRETNTGTGETQFSRAMRELGINLICANSPQAKSRVEKSNRTLQDRLVKEMRLNNIHNINSANEFLPLFVSDYNKRFAIEATSKIDAH